MKSAKKNELIITRDMRSDLLSLHPLHITDPLYSILKQTNMSNE